MAMLLQATVSTIVEIYKVYMTSSNSMPLITNLQ